MAKKTSTDTKRCLKLCSKEMTYERPEDRDAAHEAMIERLYGSCDTRAFWCGITQGARGPDGRVVGLPECSKPGRSCHVGLRDLT